MKVLSIMEPWASLIKEKVKYIETRGWRTTYRGELYIHACKKEISNRRRVRYKHLLELLDDTDFKYGYIIAKCKLVDCKYMDDALIAEIKKNEEEYMCGDYEIGRYAWILDDIEALENPIEVKGYIGIWNYNKDSNK